MDQEKELEQEKKQEQEKKKKGGTRRKEEEEQQYYGEGEEDEEYYYDYETASSCEKGELKMQVSSMFMCDYVEPSSDCMSSITYNWDFVLYLEGRKPKASFPNS